MCFPLAVIETVEHIFQSCPVARDVCKALLGSAEAHQSNERLDFQKWFDDNIVGRGHTIYGVEWKRVFAIAIWWLGRWRNSVVFGKEDLENADTVAWILDQYNITTRAFYKETKQGHHKCGC
nr:Non-LTR retroelement reverse transcriptase [Ipomoea batatas]